MNNEYFEKIQDLHNSVTREYSDIIHLWFTDCFSTWQWWLSLAILVIPWAVWIRFRKKESTCRLLFAGLIIIVISTHLDTIGVLCGIWSYNIDIVMIFPCLVIYDLSLLPVATMFFLQYKPTLNPFIKAVIYSGIASFVFQPIFTWMRFYNPQYWKHYYSFPIFILLYLLAHFCITRKSFKEV